MVIFLRGPSYLCFDDATGFKLSILPDIKDYSAPFFLLDFGKMYKEKCIDRKDSIAYIMYSAKGRGEVFCNNKWTTVEEGEVFYLPPSSPKIYRPIDEVWETIFFRFNGKNVVSTLGNKVFVIKDQDFTFIVDILDDMRSKFNTKNFKEYAFSKLYYLALMLENHVPDTDFTEISPDLNSTIGKSIKFINHAFTQDLPISQIAEASGVTREYFCKLFKEQTGQTCISYINDLRINRACDLMTQNPHKKIEEISLECGFRTLTYFNRVFKQKLNLSPSEYRQKVSKGT